MDAVSPQPISRRTHPSWPGGLGLVLSVAFHATLLPLIGGFWLLTPTKQPPPPQAIEVTLAWMPPPAAAVPAPTATATATAPSVAPPAESRLAAPAPPPAKPRPSTARPATARPARHPRPLAHRAAPLPPKPAPPAAAVAAPSARTPAEGSPPAGRIAAAPPAAAGASIAPPLDASAAAPPAKAEILARYSRTLLDRLERHKTYPLSSQRRGEEGTIVVRLTVAEDGHLIHVEPVGDGPHRLVEASLAAVQAGAPFPPLPAELGTRVAIFSLPITYRLR